jgi:hypothetical protein
MSEYRSDPHVIVKCMLGRLWKAEATEWMGTPFLTVEYGRARPRSEPRCAGLRQDDIGTTRPVTYIKACKAWYTMSPTFNMWPS